MIIPAKGGSKRLENKNMRLLNGKPMLYYSIVAAQKSTLIDKIYVSTDSMAIADYAREMGVEFIMRPSRLVGDAPVTDVYRHALRQINNNKISYVVGLQPDHPDRTVDLDIAIRFMQEKGFEDLFSVDAGGHKNGSLRIIKADVLSSKRTVLVGTTLDDCTNIHTNRELLRAERKLKGNAGIITIGERMIGEYRLLLWPKEAIIISAI